jgi:serine/threonine-protein kinase HipA
MGDAGHKVGVLHHEAAAGRQHSVFTYDPAWIDAPHGFPISPAMPFARGRFFTAKGDGEHASPFPGPIADTCPDAWGRAILNRDRRARGGAASDVDYLAGVDDAARLGALRFAGPDGRFVRPAEAGRPIVPPVMSLADLMRASDAIESRSETAKDIKRLVGAGSSLGGARPKCTVVDPDGRLLIAKFTSKRDTLPVERAEVATMSLARLVGIDMPDATILPVAGRAVALMPRFDRDGSGRIPYISAQTMLSRPSADGGSYEAMAEEIRRHGARPAADLAQLFSRVAFTILASNVDDHLRNHAFLHAGRGRWVLSPAFDVNPSPERDRRLKTTIAEGSGDDASIALLVSKAAVFGMDEGKAATTVTRMAGLVTGEWHKVFARAGMTTSEIAAYEPAFRHSEAETALAMAGPRAPARAKTTVKNPAKDPDADFNP